MIGRWFVLMLVGGYALVFWVWVVGVFWISPMEVTW